MIQEYTTLTVADNSGAKKIRCFKVLGGTRRRYARIGDVIIASVREAGINRCRTAPRASPCPCRSR